jgi:hypothetical protein
MKAPTFAGKPSETHVVWRQSGGGEKRFDGPALAFDAAEIDSAERLDAGTLNAD